MYRIIDSRGSGKTSRLFLLAKENNAAIACSNPYAMRTKAAAYGISGIQFITYKEAMEGAVNVKAVMVDDIERFAQFAINYKVLGFTASSN
jgi:hypothetical protein